MQWKIKKIIRGNIPNVQLHPIVEQLLLQRGVMTSESVEQFLHPRYDTGVHDPFLFRDMERVVVRIKQAINDGQCIGIFGDHDADGVSSAALLSEGLELLGATVVVYIPDKITEGHGINADAIDLFVSESVQLMISVDCGTSSYDAVDYAREKGIDVIITDHHHAPDILPQAYAIINPQLKEETYPFRDLSGTAVAFKVVQAIFMHMAPDRVEQLKWLLDVVSVGTIADCMPLVGENRTLVTYGLIVLGKTRRIGYQQICHVGKFCAKMDQIRADTVAYHIAPRINAAGRMRHAKHAYELLREKKVDEAHKKALKIEEFNDERKKITDQITRRVEKIVEKNHRDSACIIVAHEEYPVGIIGIVAGRIAEKFKKPTGIFTRFVMESRGSFRSFDGVHIVDVLHACEEYIVKFGGHEKAAGATITHEKFDAFVERINACVMQMLDAIPKPYVDVDMEIDLSDVSIDLARMLIMLEPFGEGNTEPLFVMRDVSVVDMRPVGSTGTHMKVILTDKNKSVRMDAIGFSISERFKSIACGDVIDILAHVQINVWNGRESVQLRLIDVKKK